MFDHGPELCQTTSNNTIVGGRVVVMSWNDTTSYSRRYVFFFNTFTTKCDAA